MSNQAAYKLEHLSKGTKNGITQPVQGLIRSIVKFDSPEMPTCVYNEIVALQLGRLFSAPISDGALVVAGSKVAFASLEVGLPGLKLGKVSQRRLAEVADTYPNEVSSLLALDYWIGNWDRAQNFRAALISDQIRLFKGFDHSHSLLGVCDSPNESCRRLASEDPVILSHPFYKFVGDLPVEKWIERICNIPSFQIAASCEDTDAFPGISYRVREELSAALITRQCRLEQFLI